MHQLMSSVGHFRARPRSRRPDGIDHCRRKQVKSMREATRSNQLHPLALLGSTWLFGTCPPSHPISLFILCDLKTLSAIRFNPTPTIDASTALFHSSSA